MSLINEILTEYSRMRHNGLDAKTTLQALRPYIEPMTEGDKKFLAEQLRTWEKSEAQVTVQTVDHAIESAPQKSKKSSVIKPIKAQPPEQPKRAFSDVPGPTLSEKNVCSRCGAENGAEAIFCSKCGNMISQSMSQFETHQFNDTDSLFSDTYYSPDSTLILRLRDTGQYYELRPQEYDQELILGRSTANSAMIPDIDLLDYQGTELGVSRLHLSLQYHGADNAIQVYDLGSANGSYINGQKLHPKEIRLLRHNDELRIGRLVIQVEFRHNNQGS